MTRRAVITGLGVACPVGNEPASMFTALIEGRSGVASLSFEVPDGCGARIGAEVTGLDPDSVMGRKPARRHGRFTHLAMAAAKQALADAALGSAGYHSNRIATILGVGIGGIEITNRAAVTLDRCGPRQLRPFELPALLPNIAAGMVAIEANAHGPCYTIASACASSGHAIGEALQLIRRGDADVVVCGGTESGMTPIGVVGFDRMGALSRRNDEPARASRPFDRDRDGFVMGEGAGILVLEEREAATRRGATIYAEVAGYGASCDAFHETKPSDDGVGAAAAMRAALDNARIAPTSIDYVNAHGTSTLYNDAVETTALKNVFGDWARQLWVSSTKSAMGHLLGAAGAVECIVTALTLQRGVVPPTLNLDHPDEQCDLDYVAHTARDRRCRYALSNTFGFGGQNACLVLGAA